MKWAVFYTLLYMGAFHLIGSVFPPKSILDNRKTKNEKSPQFYIKKKKVVKFLHKIGIYITPERFFYYICNDNRCGETSNRFAMHIIVIKQYHIHQTIWFSG